jgi:hypothetical protein
MSVNNLKQGVKLDQEKLRYDLIPPHALADLAFVYTLGSKKYGDNNYRLGINWSRIYGALMRHIEAWRKGEDIDPKDGQKHLASCAWAALTLLEYDRFRKEFDDRPAWWEEEWKMVPNYSSYEISNMGRVRKKYSMATIKRYKYTNPYKMIQLVDNGVGYKTINFHKNNKAKRFYIHRLVFELFIRPLEPKEKNNHRDGNPSNNMIWNLESIDDSGNILDAYRRGRKRVKPGETSKT